MKAYNNPRLGTFFIKGNTALSSYNNVYDVVWGRDRLTFYNPGTYNGDHKKPNAFGYLKSGIFSCLQSYYEAGGAYSRPYTTIKYGASTDGYPVNPFHGFLLDADWARINDSCLGKVYNHIRGNSNLAVDLAESAATIKMLRNAMSVRRMAKEFTREVISSRTYKRIKGPSAGARRLDYASGKWLEYRYGWLPLLSSVYDLIETLQSKLFGVPIKVVVRSGWSGSTESISGDGSITSPRQIDQITRFARRELGLYFELPDGLQVYDLTSLNPLGIAWELVPLSFVADWFVNVGQMLELWENHTIFSKHFVSGYQSDSSLEMRLSTRRGSYHRGRKYAPNGDLYPDVYDASLVEFGGIRVTDHSRIILDSLPTPAGFRFKVNLNAKRVVDAGALIRQAFKAIG